MDFISRVLVPVWIFLVGLLVFRVFWLDVKPFDISNIFLGLFFLGVSLTVLWYTFRFKKVGLLGDYLLVSNYSKEIKIPYSEISYVTERFWNSIHPIIIHLKNPTKFGSKIVFMPTHRFFGMWTSHPIVKELNDLAINHKHNPISDSQIQQRLN